MKVLAICDIDEDKIKNVSIHETEIIDKVANEFGWLAELGITLDDCKEINKVISQETYQAFIWDITKNKYVSTGQSYLSKRICKARLEENIVNGWIPYWLDTSKCKICKCTTYAATGKYEDVESGD